ncbi:hypothetical protein C5167_031655 [Papaver somniferum]|uniref:BED-type domain-containing protein n=1 Tax=Papaver somniferum TaxID=3469 RepID=A0A4Y7K6G1_PAPSO|nr:hypothetical protein C5167_031655 [Papaver somniferum]
MQRIESLETEIVFISEPCTLTLISFQIQSNLHNMSKQRQSKISFGGSKQPVDPTWEHCKVVTGGKKTVLTCNYCGNKYSGGVYRMKQNLAQTKKDAAMCKEVPPEIKQFFLSYIKKFENDKEKCEAMP